MTDITDRLRLEYEKADDTDTEQTLWDAKDEIERLRAALAKREAVAGVLPRHDFQKDVIDAAVVWWKHNRPIGWDQRTHIQHPVANCVADGEANLARHVASMLAAAQKGGE